jgi:hypothetical protein
MLAAEFQTYIGNQVVATFVDAAQRSTQLPSPDTGQLSTLDSKPGALYIWTGGAWSEVAPYFQSGSSIVTTNGAGGAVITFPVAFASTPATVQLTDGDVFTSGGISFGLIFDQVGPSYFGFMIRDLAGTPLNARTVRVSWLALGVRL